MAVAISAQASLVAAALTMFSVLPAASAQAQAAGQPVGPAQVSPLHHPELCWQAEGNGSPITLERCDAAVQGQQWTFNGDSVVMNGNGYCLQNGGTADGTGLGPQPQATLFLSFSGQCAGAPSQRWTFSGGSTNLIENSPSGLCAYARGGLVPGAPIAGRRCTDISAADTWSFGFSDLSLSGTTTSGAAPAARAGPRRAFAAAVTVSNPARAMTAFGASVSIRRPAGLSVTRLAGTASLSSWTCVLKTLSCHGSLPAGGRGQISVTGTVARPGHATTLLVRATVTRTNQAGHQARTAAIPVRTLALAAAVAGSSGKPGTGVPGAARGAPTSSVATFGLIIAVLLVAGGTVLAVVTRRRRSPGSPTLAAPGSGD